MQLDRPILNRWTHTPWVSKTPVDDRTVGGILDEEVQIGFEGDGPMSSRRLVPLSAGAHELLFGPHRDAARRLITGTLATLDGLEGAANLRGMSMSSDQASFATNLLMSNTEAGFYPDSVAASDPVQFERSMVSLIPSVRAAKAQNTGWLDLGPRVSAKLRGLVEHGAEAPREDATEVALTLLHELQHSITPHDPNTVRDSDVWLEEGVAETLAWWPGQAAALRERMGLPLRAGETIDPWSVPPDSVASTEYRNRHRSIQGLLGLAGVEPRTDDGTIDPGQHDRAMQLLQGDVIDRVPRNLSRAIVRHQHLDESLEPELRQRIVDVAGDPARVDELGAWIEVNRR
ncbi:MAG: hypothetical protein KDC46_02630 [Thermoleophilia bacterium]|nr:hypothetical protein [Thermoleophilia bacterium]